MGKTLQTLAVFAACCLSAVTAEAGKNYRELAGDMPHPYKMEFLSWGEKYAKARANVDECPLARTRTLYIDQNGAGNSTGGTGDGTLATPWLCNTLDDVTTLVNAQTSAGEAFLFKRNAVFRGAGQFNINEKVTLGAYGTGRQPEFRRVTLVTSGWTIVSGTKYTRTVSNLAWVLLPTGDGYIRLPLARQTASGNVPTTIAGTGGTWHHASTTLTMDIGVNPTGVNVELVTDNTENGVLISGDGCRVDSLTFVGYGMNTGTPANQATPIRFSGTDTEAVLITNCKAYYGSTHIIAQYTAGSGGFMAVVGCEYAWAMPNSAVTLLNGYASLGGNEFVCLDCRCVGGQLPAGTAPTAGIAAGIYGHSDGTPAALYLAQRCTNASSSSTTVAQTTPFTTHFATWGSPPTAGYNLPAFRAIWIDCDLGKDYTFQNEANNLYVNCLTDVSASGTGVVTYNAIADRGYHINGRMRATILAANTSGITNFTFLNTAQTNDAHRDHCGIWYAGDTTTTIWFDRRVGINAEIDPRVNQLCTMNNLTPSGNALASWGNTSVINAGCCYYGLTSITDVNAGYDLDLNDVTLNDPMPYDVAPLATSQLNQTGLRSLGLEYDCWGRARGPYVTAGPYATRYDVAEHWPASPFEARLTAHHGHQRARGNKLAPEIGELKLAP